MKPEIYNTFYQWRLDGDSYIYGAWIVYNF